VQRFSSTAPLEKGEIIKEGREKMENQHPTPGERGRGGRFRWPARVQLAMGRRGNRTSVSIIKGRKRRRNRRVFNLARVHVLKLEILLGGRSQRIKIRIAGRTPGGERGGERATGYRGATRQQTEKRGARTEYCAQKKGKSPTCRGLDRLRERIGAGQCCQKNRRLTTKLLRGAVYPGRR